MALLRCMRISERNYSPLSFCSLTSLPPDSQSQATVKVCGGWLLPHMEIWSKMVLLKWQSAETKGVSLVEISEKNTAWSKTVLLRQSPIKSGLYTMWGLLAVHTILLQQFPSHQELKMTDFLPIKKILCYLLKKIFRQDTFYSQIMGKIKFSIPVWYLMANLLLCLFLKEK